MVLAILFCGALWWYAGFRFPDRMDAVVAAGYRADLNLIDEAELAVLVPEMVQDLPAGGKRYIQRAAGYRATLQSGQVTFRNGESTGALPGQLVRGAQPAPA